MQLQDIFSDKILKPKEKTELLSKWLLDNPKKVHHLVEFAQKSKDPDKATCIEAFEFGTKVNPELADTFCFDFFTASLKEKAPRIKWESAKVIGNIAALHKDNLHKAIGNLLENTEHSGTVVRWSAAFALGEILKLKTSNNKKLLPAIEAICSREDKNSIRKIYLSAIKKTQA